MNEALGYQFIKNIQYVLREMRWTVNRTKLTVSDVKLDLLDDIDPMNE